MNAVFSCEPEFLHNLVWSWNTCKFIHLVISWTFWKVIWKIILATFGNYLMTNYLLSRGVKDVRSCLYHAGMPWIICHPIMLVQVNHGFICLNKYFFKTLQTGVFQQSLIWPPCSCHKPSVCIFTKESLDCRLWQPSRVLTKKRFAVIVLICYWTF